MQLAQDLLNATSALPQHSENQHTIALAGKRTQAAF